MAPCDRRELNFMMICQEGFHYCFRLAEHESADSSSGLVITPASPTPRQLFRLLDGGEITREQFRAAMALHAESLIEEMVEVHENPVAAWLETLRNRRAAAKLRASARRSRLSANCF